MGSAGAPPAVFGAPPETSPDEQTPFSDPTPLPDHSTTVAATSFRRIPSLRPARRTRTQAGAHPMSPLRSIVRYAFLSSIFLTAAHAQVRRSEAIAVAEDYLHLKWQPTRANILH